MYLFLYSGAVGSIVVEALCYRSRVGFPMKSLHFFLIYLILPAALGPGDYAASNRNEYQNEKKNSREQCAVGA
jgi:hypothetical protein